MLVSILAIVFVLQSLCYHKSGTMALATKSKSATQLNETACSFQIQSRKFNKGCRPTVYDIMDSKLETQINFTSQSPSSFGSILVY